MYRLGINKIGIHLLLKKGVNEEENFYAAQGFFVLARKKPGEEWVRDPGSISSWINKSLVEVFPLARGEVGMILFEIGGAQG